MAPPLDKGKGKARAPSPLDPTFPHESSPLIPPSPHRSTHSTISTPSRKPSAILRHGRGPLVRDSDDEASISSLNGGDPSPNSLERGSVLDHSSSAYTPGGFACGFFAAVLFTLLLIVAITHLWFGHLVEELGKSGSLEEMGKRGIRWEGPTAVRLRGADAEGGAVVLEVEGKVAMDVRRALGWEGESHAGARIWRTVENGMAGWVTRKVGVVNVAVGRLVVSDPTTRAELVVIESFDRIRVPLAYPTDDDTDVQLGDFQLNIPISFPNPKELVDFAKRAWALKAVRARVEIDGVEVEPGEKIGGIVGGLIAPIGSVRVDEIARTLEAQIPDIPGVSDPASLVHLSSYEIFPSTAPDNTKFVAIAAHAELVNPLRNSSILPPHLAWGMPFSLPVAIFLPSPTGDAPSLPPASPAAHNDPVLVARVYTSPFTFSDGAKAATLDVAGSLVHPDSKDPSSPASDPNLGPALSKFVSTYLSGKNNTILVRYDPDAEVQYGVLLPPPVVGKLAKDVEVALSFPGSDSELELFRNLRIEDMEINFPALSGLGGWWTDDDGDTEEGDLLCSGKVVGEILLPETFRSLAGEIDVSSIWPDVYVYDGELPKADDVDEPSLGTPQLSFSLAPPAVLSPSDYPPDPLPATAFARLRPALSIPTSTSHFPGNATHPPSTTISAVFVDAPLFLLPGREDVFRRFVAKILFGGGGKVRAGVRGVTGVGVGIGGWGDVGLEKLPIEGSFDVGRGGVESVGEEEE